MYDKLQDVFLLGFRGTVTNQLWILSLPQERAFLLSAQNLMRR